MNMGSTMAGSVGGTTTGSMNNTGPGGKGMMGRMARQT